MHDSTNMYIFGGLQEVAVKKFLDQDFYGDALDEFRSEVGELISVDINDCSLKNYFMQFLLFFF